MCRSGGAARACCDGSVHASSAHNCGRGRGPGRAAAGVNAEGSPVTRDDFVLAHILHHGSFRRPELMARLDLSEERHGVLPTHRGVAHHHRRHLRRSMVMNERVQAVPDPTDKNTVLQLAEMSFNAYEDYNDSDDWKVISGFNITGVDNWVADSMRAYV